MRAHEFLIETHDATLDDELVITAQKYLTQFFKRGIGDRSAVSSVIDVLHTRGADLATATAATKKAFVNIKGSDVTTEE